MRFHLPFRNNKAPSNLLSVDGRDPIWPRVSITRAQYEQTYIAFSKALFRDIEPNEYVALAAASLRLRKQYLLPIGCDPETASSQSEAWSFAVFVSSIAFKLGISNMPTSSQAWLPTYLNAISRDWIAGDVYAALDSSVSGSDQPNAPLLSIVRTADSIMVESQSPFLVTDPAKVTSLFVTWLKQAIENKEGILTHDHDYFIVDNGIFCNQIMLSHFLADSNIALSKDALRLQLDHFSSICESCIYTIVGRKQNTNVVGLMVKVDFDLPIYPTTKQLFRVSSVTGEIETSSSTVSVNNLNHTNTVTEASSVSTPVVISNDSILTNFDLFYWWIEGQLGDNMMFNRKGSDIHVIDETRVFVSREGMKRYIKTSDAAASIGINKLFRRAKSISSIERDADYRSIYIQSSKDRQVKIMGIEFVSALVHQLNLDRSSLVSDVPADHH